MAETLLGLRNISVRYRTYTALEVPSLEIQRGKVLAIMGPNGAGKSSLLRVMGLLQQPDHGQIYFQGQDVRGSDSARLRRRIATVFQEPLLLSMSVYSNVELGLRLRGWDRRDGEKRVRLWLERLGIDHIAQRSARVISGGEAQRTSLARALVLDPELLLLDEPFAALDPPTRETLLIELEEILRETAITTVFVTHDREEALMLGDTVAVMIGGKILQMGSSEEVFFRPADEKVAEFVGAGNIVTGVVEDHQDGFALIRFAGGRLRVFRHLARGEQVRFCVRPEEITLTLAGNETPTLDSHIRLHGTVSKIITGGFYSRVILDCGGIYLQALVGRPTLIALSLEQGNRIIAEFPASAVHVIAPGRS